MAGVPLVSGAVHGFPPFPPSPWASIAASFARSSADRFAIAWTSASRGGVVLCVVPSGSALPWASAAVSCMLSVLPVRDLVQAAVSPFVSSAFAVVTSLQSRPSKLAVVGSSPIARFGLCRSSASGALHQTSPRLPEMKGVRVGLPDRLNGRRTSMR